MSISELDLYCRDIATSYTLRDLTKLRVIFDKMQKAGSISYGIYKGLNSDIRNRADWLKRRGNK